MEVLQDEVVDVLFEPAAGEVFQFAFVEDAFFLRDESDFPEAFGEEWHLRSVAAACGFCFGDVDGAAVAIVDAEQLQRLVCTPELLSCKEFVEVCHFFFRAYGVVEVWLAVEVVLQSVCVEVFLHGHAVADGIEEVVVVVDTVVVDCLYDEVLVDVHVEVGGVVSLEDMLHGECHVACASCQVDVIDDVLFCILFEACPDDAADFLVGDFVVVRLEDDGFYEVFRNVKDSGEEGEVVLGAFGGDEHQAVSCFVLFLDEKIGGDGIVVCDDVNKCLGHGVVVLRCGQSASKVLFLMWLPVISSRKSRRMRLRMLRV